MESTKQESKQKTWGIISLVAAGALFLQSVIFAVLLLLDSSSAFSIVRFMLLAVTLLVGIILNSLARKFEAKRWQSNLLLAAVILAVLIVVFITYNYIMLLVNYTKMA